MGNGNGKFGIFISYSFEIESLARRLRDKLQLLDDENRLDVFIASELGGKKWREEIDAHLASASLLVLPFPYAAMKLDWVCFELGRLNRDAVPVCIMNTHLAKPPDQLAEWNAFKAEKESLKQFFQQVFASGVFTGGQKINPKINNHPDFRQRLTEAVAEIETEFAAFRVEERFYARRITIASPPLRSSNGAQTPARLSFQTAEVRGSQDTLDMFGVEDGATWRALKASCESHSSSAWLAEVERVPQLAEDHVLSRTLTPFRNAQRRTFIPVVSKVESIEKKPTRVNVIFIEASSNVRVGPEVFGNFEAMPAAWSPLFVFLDLGRRYRWETLAPVRSKLKWEVPPDAPAAQWAPVAQQVMDGAAELQKQMRGIGITTDDQLFGAFPDAEIGDSLREKMAGWGEAAIAFDAALRGGDRAGVMEALNRISRVNIHFLDHTLRQIGSLVAKLS